MISSPLSASNSIKKNKEINITKYNHKTKSKTTPVKIISITKKRAKFSPNIENLTNFYKRTHSNVFFSNDDLNIQILKQNFSQKVLNSKEMMNNNINLDYSQCFLDKNKENNNDNSNSQDSVFIKNKYKNLIHKFC